MPSRSVRIRQKAEEDVAEQQRLADTLFTLTVTAAPAKELRVYGLADELVRRHKELGAVVGRSIRRAALLAAGLSAVGLLLYALAARGNCRGVGVHRRLNEQNGSARALGADDFDELWQPFRCLGRKKIGQGIEHE